MKNKIAAVVLTLAMLVPLTGNAASTYRSNNTTSPIGTTKVYLGVKYGLVTFEVDAPGADGIEMDNMGFVFGGHINDNLALELDYIQTVSEGREDIGGGASASYSTDSLGLYLVYKTIGTVYFKGRAGYARMDQEISTIGPDTIYGLTYGLGIGIDFSATTSLEVEYTRLPESDKFDRFGSLVGEDIITDMISVGFVWSYN